MQNAAVLQRNAPIECTLCVSYRDKLIVNDLHSIAHVAKENRRNSFARGNVTFKSSRCSASIEVNI